MSRVSVLELYTAHLPNTSVPIGSILNYSQSNRLQYCKVPKSLVSNCQQLLLLRIFRAVELEIYSNSEYIYLRSSIKTTIFYNCETEIL